MDPQWVALWAALLIAALGGGALARARELAAPTPDGAAARLPAFGLACALAAFSAAVLAVFLVVFARGGVHPTVQYSVGGLDLWRLWVWAFLPALLGSPLAAVGLLGVAGLAAVRRAWVYALAAACGAGANALAAACALRNFPSA